MSSIDFRTKTMILPRQNVAAPNVWGMAIDIGYSGVKVYSPNIIACFPAFAIPVKGNLLEVAATEDMILYRDAADKRTWYVGKAAQDSISTQDPDTSSMAIYGRQRYFDPMFTVLARTAIGLASMRNQYGDPMGKIKVLETGLPNTYLKSDSVFLHEVLEGFHSFDLKIGNSDWMHFECNLSKGNVFVMAQPLGTLLSITTGEDGQPLPEANDYYTSSVLICDPGFGTMDCFSVKSLAMSGMETFDSLGMKQVLLNTSNEIFNRYHTEIPVPAMQSFLEKGYITTFDRKTRQGVKVDFNPILEQCSADVAKQAVAKISELYNDLLEYKYFVLTGGTGEAWYSIFQEAFGGIPDLQIIPGNKNTEGILKTAAGEPAPLPFIFSNVRGYYMFLQHKFMG